MLLIVYASNDLDYFKFGESVYYENVCDVTLYCKCLRCITC